MLFIKHRCNNFDDLENTPKNYGIEIDIRSFKEELILNHEPYEIGPIFEEWLKKFDHKFLILNVKEEGIESRCLDLVKRFNIKDYFFLDQSFPMLIKSARTSSLETSIRFSEYESIETVLKFKDLVSWVWVDYYEKYPLNDYIVNILKKNNFKICLVSPELQGYNTREIKTAYASIKNFYTKIDAICTKNISFWESY